MKERTLFHVDAFTTTRFRGNPAGVVLNADGMSDAEMQDLARELKHSETAFVLAPDGADHDVRLRYFSPTTEVPLCGHATIATHYVRAGLPGFGSSEFRQKTAAGIQRIRIGRNEAGGRRVFMQQERPRIDPPLDASVRHRIAAALGVADDQLTATLPLQVVSTGHGKVMVPLEPTVDLDALAPRMPALAALSAEIGCNGYFAFQLRKGEAATDGRMFAPAIGIDEDPVTGNANGPLGAYLVHHRLLPHDGASLRFAGHQGRALRRDGIVHVEVRIVDDEPVEVTIAGDACILFSAPLSG